MSLKVVKSFRKQSSIGRINRIEWFKWNVVWLWNCGIWILQRSIVFMQWNKKITHTCPNAKEAVSSELLLLISCKCDSLFCCAHGCVDNANKQLVSWNGTYWCWRSRKLHVHQVFINFNNFFIICLTKKC